MTGADAPSPKPASRSGRRPARHRLRRAATAALIVIGVILLLLVALYLNRRAAAREVLVGWLDRQGIQADVEVERLEMDGFVGRIRVGDPRDPDFQVERAEVDYAIAAPWSRGGLGVTPSRIRLIRPIVKASWIDGKLSMGSLDPLVERFTGQPPRPDSTAPLVIVETGRLRLNTEYGPLQVLADARMQDGKLMRLSARMPAASLKSGDVEARGLGGVLGLATVGDRTAIRFDLSAERAGASGSTAEGVRLTGAAGLPYPDLKTRRGDGGVTIDAALVAARLSLGDKTAREIDADLDFEGQAKGWIDDLALAGRADLDLAAAGLAGPGLSAGRTVVGTDGGRLSFARTAQGPSWSLEGPAQVQTTGFRSGDLALDGARLTTDRLSAGGRGAAMEVSGPLALTADRFAFGEFALRRATATLAVDVEHQGATRIAASGAVRAADGAWPLFGPVAADDVPELAEMKRALGGFALDVPRLRLTTGSAGTEVVLDAPARITPANGGAASIRPAARPIFAAAPGRLGGGALDVVATRGRGLPEATVAVPDWRMIPDGFEADLRAVAALDFGTARGLRVTTNGRMISRAGRLTYGGPDCLGFAAERLELGENDAMDLSGRFCPDGDRPLVEVAEGGWRADGRVADVTAWAPFLAARVDQGEGTVAVRGSDAGLGLQARVVSARVADTTEPRRFNPLSMTGTAALDGERWTGDFYLMSGQTRVADVALIHDGATEAGGVSFDTGLITFADPGLQPDDLTPLTRDFVQSPVVGQVGFAGRFDWSPDLPEGGSSSGVLTVPGLDFVSPAGPVKGLKGVVAFTNLAPLATADDQTLHVDLLETVAPLTDLDVTFALDKAAFTVDAGAIRAAGGVVTVEPFAVPLAGGPIQGVVVLDKVQLGEIVAGAGFGDKVELDAVVSGRLPFTYDPAAGARIAGGTLAAVQPGRLSIRREALTGLQAGGGGDAVPPSTVEDLAYQAMENLAFEQLDATVNSLDEGRVGVLFHIKGRHDPPRRQELRLSLTELISRRFLERNLPLPSDTGIDLTLDTTLNLNQLISDLLAVNRARAGEAAATNP